jgi:hypothetical protein
LFFTPSARFEIISLPFATISPSFPVIFPRNSEIAEPAADATVGIAPRIPETSFPIISIPFESIAGKFDTMVAINCAAADAAEATTCGMAPIIPLTR